MEHVESPYGTVKSDTFMASGNLLELYKHLKVTFEPPKNNNSGAVKPLTKEERLAEENKPLAEFLKEEAT